MCNYFYYYYHYECRSRETLISENDARAAILEHFTKNVCYGQTAIKEMNFNKFNPLTTHQVYCLFNLLIIEKYFEV